jgi:predicted DNA-binding antitoxin AbrB/MazE fold protein
MQSQRRKKRGASHMTEVIEAIYENGLFRPLHPEAIAVPCGQVVRLTVENASDPEPLQLASRVYEGLSADDIADVERIALERKNYFDPRSVE